MEDINIQDKRRRPHSEEHKRKLSISNKIAHTGKKLSKEHKDNISKGLRNSEKRREYEKGISVMMKEKWVSGKMDNRKNYWEGKKIPQEIKDRRVKTWKQRYLEGKIKRLDGEFNPRYIKLDEKKIIQLYEKGLSAIEIGKILGVSNCVIYRRLRKNGIKIRDVLFGNKERIRTDDGHLVKSSPELIIDNFLFNNKIHHIYDGNIADTNHKFDFYIPGANLYIEYWGLERFEKYKNRTIIKLELYKKLGLNLLSIYPKEDIHKKLLPLLKFSGIQRELDEFIVLN